MRIIVEHNGEAIWMRDNETGEGIACTKYIKDGTQQKIIAALGDAIHQANGELLCGNYTDGVADVSAATT
ncbi:Rrf2 family transcriptional regulator [Enterobacter asburiae]|uniref:Rrf2 family transcriptional regulator n=1 Tax=Enterobacter asburiae TaxID=61645 RepID=UPI003BC84860